MSSCTRPIIGARLPRTSGRLVLCRLTPTLFTACGKGWWNRWCDERLEVFAVHRFAGGDERGIACFHRPLARVLESSARRRVRAAGGGRRVVVAGALPVGTVVFSDSAGQKTGHAWFVLAHPEPDLRVWRGSDGGPVSHPPEARLVGPVCGSAGAADCPGRQGVPDPGSEIRR